MLKLPPPIWAFAYLLIAAVISYLAGWPGTSTLRIVPLAIVLIIAGIASAVSAALLFRSVGTDLNPTSATNAKLVVSGPFRFTRNPMYLGLVLFTLGIAFWVGAWPMLLVPVAIFATVNWSHIPFEEAKMRRQFGAAYDDYVARVRRWL
jgi:protein-S-isoprenylcysteine O-methyltransferase Ste14